MQKGTVGSALFATTLHRYIHIVVIVYIPLFQLLSDVINIYYMYHYHSTCSYSYTMAVRFRGWLINVDPRGSLLNQPRVHTP